MKLHDDLPGFTGELEILCHDARTGELIERREEKNIVVTVGKNWIAQLMGGQAPTLMAQMAIGSSNTAAASADTQLGNQLARVALTSTTVSNNTVTYSATFNAGIGNTGSSDALVYEAGIFNAAAGGTLLAHTVFGLITKDVNMVITINWTITAN